MGRYYFNARTTVEQAMQLNIFKLKKSGLLCGYVTATMTWTRIYSGHESSIGICVDTEELYAKANYTITDQNTDEKTDCDYQINLTTTPCYFGGVRYWFICPLSVNGEYCGRRVGTLYLASGGNYFGCRHCYNLSYKSQNESRLGRFGNIGFPLKAEEQYEQLYMSIKRWTWRGRPTRKVRKLQAIEARLNAYL